MQNELQRVLNLAKKTGDRVIVFDYVEPKNTYVVMGLEEYEGMVETKDDVKGLTESELLDKINGDIAQWKNRSDFNILESSDTKVMEDKVVSSKTETIKQQEVKTEANERPPMQNKNSVRSKNWSIPKTIKEAAEQVMEEDKPYADEVSF